MDRLLNTELNWIVILCVRSLVSCILLRANYKSLTSSMEIPSKLYFLAFVHLRLSAKMQQDFNLFCTWQQSSSWFYFCNVLHTYTIKWGKMDCKKLIKGIFGHFCSSLKDIHNMSVCSIFFFATKSFIDRCANKKRSFCNKKQRTCCLTS